MARLARMAASAAVPMLLLCCLSTAATRELQQARNQALPYAPSLYECVVKAGLKDLQAALDAAGLKVLLSNPKTAMTLVAPDAAGFQAAYTDCQSPAKVKAVNKVPWCSLDALVKDKAGVSELMRYHLLPGVREAKPKMQHFPASKTFIKLATYQGTIVRMRLYQGGYEIHGTGRDAFVRGGKTGIPTGGNFRCGAGLMHVVDNLMTIDKASKDYVKSKPF